MTTALQTLVIIAWAMVVYFVVHIYRSTRMARQHRIEACHNPATGKYWWHWITPNNKLFAPGQVYHGPRAKEVAIKEGKQAARYIKNSRFVDRTDGDAILPEPEMASKDCP